MRKLNTFKMGKWFLILALFFGWNSISGQSTFNFTVTQYTTTVGQGSKLQPVVYVRLCTGARDILDNMQFKITGKDNIQSAKLYFANGNNTFQFWQYLYGTEITSFPSDTITFTKTGNENYDLSGDVYFFLVLEIKPTATLAQVVDAECLSVFLNGFSTLKPAAGNPVGARKIVAPMTGTYTIKGTAGPNNFTKLSAAIDTLNRWGFTGGVTFELQDDSVFAENFSAKWIYQTGSATNIITFKRSGTGTNKPIVRPTGTNSGDDAGFTFWGTDYVIVDGIMIDGPTVSTNKVDFGIRLRNAKDDGCQNVTIQNCTIQLDSTLDTRAIYTNRTIPITSADGNSNKLRILNNIIKKARWGIFIDNGNYSQLQEDSVIISGNVVSNLAINDQNSAIYARDIKNLIISNNEVKDIRLGTNYANWYRGMDIAATNLFIYGNKIHGITNPGALNSSKTIGIIAYGQNSYIYNNMMWDVNVSVNTIQPAGQEVLRGIDVQGYNNIGYSYVYNNTVFLNSPTSTTLAQWSSAMHVENNITWCELKNNIMVNLSTGTGAFRNMALYYNIDHVRTYSTASDNNLFYAGTPSANNLVARMNGTEFQTLKAYQAAGYGRDLHSITENAPFISAADLHINNSVATWIEKGGIPVGAVATDIDGDLRDASTPDIGADEGAFLASIKDTLGPKIVYTLLPDTSSSLVGLTISGVVITDSAKVDTLAGTKPRLYYKRSNTANAFPTPAQNATTAFNGWRYVEASNNSSPFTFTMNYAILNGLPLTPGTVIEYFIAAQDFHVGPNVVANPPQSIGISPNIGGLVANANRITNNYKIISNTPMSGDYLVGVGDGEPYATLNAAYTALSNTYITGPVRLLLNDVTYNLAATSVTLGEVKGASKTNTITIKPNVGVSPVISYTPGGDNNCAIILNGADYYTIDGSNTVGGTTRDLTIQTTTTDYSGAVINVRTLGTGKGAKCDSIKNCIIRGAVAALTDNVYGIASGGNNVATGDDNDSLVIQNNLIYRLRYGIFIKGYETGRHNVVTIVGNTLDSLTRNGIELERIDKLVVDKNIIRNINTGADANARAAMWIGISVTNAEISNNQIYNLSNTAVNQVLRGIDVNTGNQNANISLYNNMISGVLGQHSYGIYFSNTGNFKIDHNSVNLYGDQTAVTPANNLIHAPIRLVNSVNGEILNNIFNNTIKTAEPTANTYKTYAFYLEGNSLPSQVIINNNALWVYNKGLTDKGWFSYYTADRRTFNDWRSLTGFDQNGYADSIPFVAPNDLHVDPAKVTKIESTGAATVFSSDYDGEARNATTPDIGADEGTFTASQISPTKSQIISVTPYSTPTFNPGATILFQAKDAAGVDIATGEEKITFSVRNVTGTSYGTVGATYDSLNGRYTAKLTVTRAGTEGYVNAYIGGILCTDTARFIATNTAPTAQTISHTKVNEEFNNAFVGIFKTTDADTTGGDKFTYTLVTGTGSTHNAQFKIVKDTLKTNIVINFTSALPTRSIRIRATDMGGLYIEKAYTININDRPTDLSVNPSVINDSLPTGTMVANLATLDSNGIAETFTYTLVPGPGDTNNVSFHITGDKLYVDSSFKKALTPKMYIRVKTVDQDTLSLTKAFVIMYNNKPTGLYLTKYIIPEGLAIGSLATKIKTIDADTATSDVFTYTLEPGGVDNALFKIGHDSLLVNAAIAYATKSVLAVIIRTTDFAGSTFVKDTLIKLNAIPTNIVMSKTRINDGTLAGKFFAKLSTVDPGSWAGAKFIYAKVTGTGSTDNALVTLSNDSLFIVSTVNYATKPSYAIRLRTTDSLGVYFEKAISIPVNVAPTLITASTYVINDSTAKGVTVCTLTATDPNGPETFTYSMIAGAGDTNNVSFHLVGNQLIVDSVFAYANTKTVYVRIEVMDTDSLKYQRAIVIAINTRPTNIYLSPQSVQEAQAKFASVGILNSVDPNGHALIYSLPAVLDNSQFTLTGGNRVITNAVFDYETQKTYTIMVRGTDPGGLYIERQFTITVTNAYEAPTDVTLSSSSVDERLPSGALVGEFSNNDPDSADVITYSLVTGTGSTDNASFKIVGDSLVTNTIFDYETKKTYSIRVRAKDLGNKTFDKVFSISINDINETSIKEISEIAAVYPVPTNGILNINYMGSGRPQITLTDMNGKQVYSGYLNSDLTTLDLSKNAKGMYIIKITEGSDVYTGSVTLE